MKNNSLGYKNAIIGAVASIMLIATFYVVNTFFVRTEQPNVFLNFQFTSHAYYKIMIDDSLVIDSNQIQTLAYSSAHYKTKGIDLVLKKGIYKFEIRDASERIISDTLLKIDDAQPKYLYFRKRIHVQDYPNILI